MRGVERAPLGGRIDRPGARGPRPAAAARRLAQRLPLVEQAGVDLAQQRAQVREDVLDLLGARRLGHGLHQRLVDLRQVAQQHALAALQPVLAHVVVEASRSVSNISRAIDFGPDVLLRRPTGASRERVEGVVDEVAVAASGTRASRAPPSARRTRRPAAFSSAIFSVLSWSSCLRRARRPGSRGSTRPASARRARRSAPARSSSASVSSRYSDSVWWSEKSRCSSGVDLAPCGRAPRSPVHDARRCPRARSDRKQAPRAVAQALLASRGRAVRARR